MKTRLHFLQYSRQTRSGIALISVLAMIVLLTALVVAFMLRAGNERQASGFYKAESGARALADTTINIVQAQINEATGQGPTYAWASQPGAIRTYKNDGTLFNLYRLYSSSSLRTGTPSDIGTYDMPSGSTWPAEPALWVDLNAPVNNDPAKAPINTHFPILDPRDPSNLAHDLSDGTGATMDGFSITNAPVNTSSSTQIDANLTANPAPMPVQWLYVLQDGSVIPPDSGSNGLQLTFASAPKQPTAANPIIGRIAFWTDDETCKININTAGADGAMVTTNGKADPSDIANRTFWAPPTFAAIDDTGAAAYGTSTNLGFANSQPASGEYQRYPGHPATVALNEILNTLGVTIPATQFYSTSNSNSSFTPGITPRYVYGGSQEGGVKSYSGAGPTAAISAIPTAGFRLYPSVSELLFNPTDRSPTPLLNTALTESVAGTTRQRMESAHFFLTAHSRSSELNLFGLPRISIWPVSSMATNWSAVDDLLTFCSTINSYAYYFTRVNGTGSANSTTDISITRNQALLTYLNTLTQQNIPGFGGNFAAKDYSGNGTGLTNQNEQILTEIFDYIRTINVGDATTSTGTYGLSSWQNSNWGCNQVVPSLVSSSTLAWNTQGFGSYPRLVEATLQFVAMGKGGTPPPTLGGPGGVNATAVSPSAVAAGLTNTTGDSSTTMTYNYTGTGGLYVAPGVGQYVAPGTYSMSGTAQVLMGPPATPPPTTGYNQVYSTYNNQTKLYSGIAPDGTTPVQAFLMLSFLNPSQSWLAAAPYVWVSVTGLDAFTLNGHALGFPHANGMACVSDSNTWHGGGRFGYYGWYDSFYAKGLNGSSPNNNPVGGYPFFSLITPISNASPTMAFNGGTITINLYDANGAATTTATGAPANGHLVQTYTIPFASGNFPVPTLPPTTPNTYGTTTTTLPSYVWVTPTVAFGTGTTATAYETTGPIIGLPEPSGSIPPDTNIASYDRWGQYGALVGIGGSDYIGTGDVLESMVLSQTWSDPRLLAIATVPSSAWVKHPNWGQQFAHNLYTAMVYPAPGNGYYPTVNGVAYSSTGGTNLGTLAGNYVDSATYNPYSFYPWAPCNFGDNAQPTTVSGAPPDWDNGISNLSDGPWINKCDEGSAPYSSGNIPYYANPNGIAASLFSANREVSSPGMFGSLPTGVDPTGAKPSGWQTLLFRPGPGAAGYTHPHPGEGIPATAGVYSPPYTTPPDHLWMDLFWMPVAEPYAISEPFSTAGKVNLNYQIVPFTYIKRATALRAAMATEKIGEVSLAQSKYYKGTAGYPTGLAQNGGNPQTTPPVDSRYPIDLDTTMVQFDAKFANWDIFRSASQICEEFLVPLDGTNNTPGPQTGVNNYTANAAGVASFATDWYKPVTSATTVAPFAMVGDNIREQPYTNLYGKLTTKSNTFTVYYRVQTLKNAEPNTDAGQAQWDETKGSITGEYRGSTTLERYIDPNEQTSAGASVFPDYATATMPTTNLESYYQWRVVENRQFTP